MDFNAANQAWAEKLGLKYPLLSDFRRVMSRSYGVLNDDASAANDPKRVPGYLRSKRAGASAELHLYAGAGHGFGVRETNRGPHAAWIERFVEWLTERKFLASAPRPNG